MASRPSKRRSDRAAMPDFVEPQLATLSEKTPSGDRWVHEIKYDGYRAQVRVDHGKVTISTRRGFDWSSKFPDIAKVAAKYPDCLIDGEAVVLDAKGRTDFSALQSALAGGRKQSILLFAFDLLFLEGDDLRSRPLLDRKEALAQLLPKSGDKHSVIRFSEHFVAAGDQMHDNACALGLEGVVSKRVNAPYRSGRNENWLKSKCGERETFLIGGWRETTGGLQSISLGALRDGKLAYVGKAKSGYRDSEDGLLKKFHTVEVPKSPFRISGPERKDGQRWAAPVLQAEVSFTAWTASKHIRHAKFLGLRQDIDTPVVAENKKPKGFGRNVQRLLAHAPIPDDDLLRRYWKKVGTKALEYLARRPLTLVRHDKGRVFFHTGVVPPTPTTVDRLTVQKREGGAGTRLWVDSVAGLVALVDAGVIEVHPWCSTVDDLEHPDVMILDLDPGEGIEWDFVRDTALSLRDFLKSEEGLSSWPKATGGKGLHLMIPLDGSRDHDAARNYARRIASSFAERGKRYTITAGASHRRGKLFIDYLRNGRGQTGVGAYSPRARPGFPVAVPLTWKKVEQGQRSDAMSLIDFL